MLALELIVSGGPKLPTPPATSTRPSGSGAAPPSARPSDIWLAVGVQALVTGLYTSALLNPLALIPEVAAPPATSAPPFFSGLASAAERAVPIGLAAPKLFVAGSYRSALLTAVPLVSSPPATSTLPLPSRMATPSLRGELMSLTVGVQECAVGS